VYSSNKDENFNRNNLMILFKNSLKIEFV